ncbi:MAG TPA: S9 family peptidase [Gammaproteobacteria bacterium]|nr:S9 family peptidase [Gammaproteobacteria bacterium]
MAVPPRAPQRPGTRVAHGESRSDPYAWLRERDNPAVIEYLRAENTWTETCTRHLEPLRHNLYREFLDRIRETDASVPVPLDDYVYYRRTERGLDYPVYCRRPREAPGSAEQVLLDANLRARADSYLSLGAVEPSPDHTLLAWSEDHDGSERYVLQVRDLERGLELPDRIGDTGGDVLWSADGCHLFYTVLDDAHRPWRVFRHRLGQSSEGDTLVYEEPDPAFFVGLDQSADRRYLLIESSSNITSETWLLDRQAPRQRPRRLLPRQEGVEYAVEHRDGELFLLTNRDALDFRLLRGSLAEVLERGWSARLAELVPHEAGRTLEGMDVFARHLVLYTREDGLHRVHVLELAGGRWRRIDFDESVYACGPGENAEFDTDTLRLVYTSPVTPRSVYDCDMSTGERVLRKRDPVLGGYRPEDYVARRLHARAPDGARVPVTVVHRRGLALDGSHPCVLHGYGAYGICMEPAFSSTRLSLLERGVVFAMAHVRGGADLGERWKEDGKLTHKRNSFTDFIACAQELIDCGYTRAGKLAIMGGSAGGLLLGAVLNMRPDLFHAALAQVPFVDVLNTMLDPSLPLTVIEYDEWGNPQEPGAYARIRDYAPYENVARQDYPHMLVTAGLNDPRVAYWEPAKWVARLREMKTDDNLLLLRTHMGAGHHGASGRYAHLEELAFEYAFLLDRLGAADGPE